jgi:hypothetical protein
MSFDGVDDVVEIPTPSFNSSLNNLTLEVWVNLNSLQASQRILDQWGALGIYTLRVENNGTATMSLNLDGMSSGGYLEYAIPTNDVGQWVHVAATYDGASLNLYRNGVLMNTTPTTGDPSASYQGNSLRIGSNPSNQALGGMIDEVRIWNTALSQQEIQQYMNCSPTGNESGLVGYWDFEEGTGGTAYDQTSNGNDAWVLNGATYDTNVPSQSCGLTNTNGCDSTAVLNLTINQADTSYTNITACDSVVWNGTTYDSSGTYSYNVDNSTSNNYSMSFDGSNDYIDCQNNL